MKNLWVRKTYTQPPIQLKNLAKLEAPLPSQLDPCNLSQNSDMTNVEACFPLPIAVLPLPNVKQSTTTKLNRGSPWTIHHTNIFQAYWGSSLICSCGMSGTISFALYRAWHSLSAYRNNSKGSMSIPLNSLSTRTFQIYQIIHG